jgi:hypothetical protein
MQTIHSDKRYQCRQCPVTFTRLDSRTKHERDCHPHDIGSRIVAPESEGSEVLPTPATTPHNLSTPVITGPGINFAASNDTERRSEPAEYLQRHRSDSLQPLTQIGLSCRPVQSVSSGSAGFSSALLLSRSAGAEGRTSEHFDNPTDRLPLTTAYDGRDPRLGAVYNLFAVNRIAYDPYGAIPVTFWPSRNDREPPPSPMMLDQLRCLRHRYPQIFIDVSMRPLRRWSSPTIASSQPYRWRPESGLPAPAGVVYQYHPHITTEIPVELNNVIETFERHLRVPWTTSHNMPMVTPR